MSEFYQKVIIGGKVFDFVDYDRLCIYEVGSNKTLIPESPATIMEDLYSYFIIKYFKNCNSSCPSSKKGHLDIDQQGICKHLQEARMESQKTKEEILIIDVSKPTLTISKFFFSAVLNKNLSNIKVVPGKTKSPQSPENQKGLDV